MSSSPGSIAFNSVVVAASGVTFVASITAAIYFSKVLKTNSTNTNPPMSNSAANSMMILFIVITVAMAIVLIWGIILLVKSWRVTHPLLMQVQTADGGIAYVHAAANNPGNLQMASQMRPVPGQLIHQPTLQAGMASLNYGANH